MIAFTLYGTFRGQMRTIWLDGRPHPSEYAPHTWQGFSTGKWEGDMLTIVTTHIKTGWLYRNGVAHSEHATMWEHWMRNGDILTFVNIVDDPAYLEEPLIRTTDWVLGAGTAARARSARTRWTRSFRRPRVTCRITCRARIRSCASEADRFHIPFEAARGGKATTYPEYQLRLRS